MSVHKTFRTLTLVGIALASLLITACSGSTTLNASSIAITVTPVAQNQVPSGLDLAHATLTPDPAHPPIPLDQLGAETSKSTVDPKGSLIGGGSSAPTSPTPVATVSAPIVNPTDAPRPTLAPSPTFAPTVAPTATPRPPEPTVQPVVTFKTYTVRSGDTLNVIAARLGVSASALMQMNGIKNANVLYVGQVLRAGKTVQVGRGPSDKLIPDSEAVYSPSYEGFDVKAFTARYGGYISRYQENVEGMNLTGPQIVQLVADRFSVGPRVLLTILEMEGGWVTGNPANLTQLYYPMGLYSPSWSGLYRQLWWAADKLNEGYYGRYYGMASSLTFSDGNMLVLSSQINPGTAAVEHYLALTNTYANWNALIGGGKFNATYQKLFGDPFAHAIEPLVPPDVTQPELHLPWADGHVWWFTGGPHGGWADGSAWAAVDFAPEAGSGTCIPSTDLDLASAPGLIVQVENGRVLENLSGKTFQGDGWTVMYMHVGQAGRVSIGTTVKTGDPIGHPSCEGGVSTADHLHFARLYNGQWIAASDHKVPMVLSGWTIQGASAEYDGSMTRGSDYLEACNCHGGHVNAIIADDGPAPTTAADSLVPTADQAAAPNGQLTTMSIDPPTGSQNDQSGGSNNSGQNPNNGSSGPAAPIRTNSTQENRFEGASNSTP